ncbi:acyl-CoA thioesterase [Phaeobacter porticola]|uniref:Putative thioesterase n=1 Tax=Phaeobacter porticola TaxID=1844006 RepID=A0A1L3I4A7_9RHOB|nr:thioesterase family protein [Phaeobacter porticola]APG46936.1 putative thioesterase [Phaeobacter porticola]
MDLSFHTPLSPDIQRQHGLEIPQPLAIADRVRFSELDILHHVNNKAYLGWFETLRVAYYNQFFALHFKGMPTPRNVLRNANVHYVKEMVLDEDYITTARVVSFRRTSYVMEQQIWSGDLRATMTGVMVLRTPDGQSGYPLPETLRTALIDRDGAIAEA